MDSSGRIGIEGSEDESMLRALIWGKSDVRRSVTGSLGMVSSAPQMRVTKRIQHVF